MPRVIHHALQIISIVSASVAFNPSENFDLAMYNEEERKSFGLLVVEQMKS